MSEQPTFACQGHPKPDPRNTQFTGFACRLLQELLDQGAYVAISEWATGGDSAKSEQLIARRAYDFAAHILDAAEVDLCGHATPDLVKKIPDLTEWPEEAAAALNHYADHQYDGVDFGDEEGSKDE